MNQRLQLIKEKVNLLNKAAKAYEQENREIMSNIEYDRLYDELIALEKETGIVLSNSPSLHVGYELLTNLPKENHEKAMLSLDKTKDVNALKEWIGDKKGILSWKMDGLTIVLTYEKGILVKAVTRGTGEVGEVITNNVKVFKNIPIQISFEGDLILRGEAIISYSGFEKINREIEDVNAKYKNPRNLCSGSVRQLNNKITSERNVYFFAFSLVKATGVEFKNSRVAQMDWIKEQGFDTVEFKEVNEDNLEETVTWFSLHAAANDFPSDGLVLAFEDIGYAEGLGATAKFPRDSIAFKWRDEIKETKLLEIEWSASRTGLINPIAIFEPVELEGTTVSRASLHNISIMEGLCLGIGDTIKVYKANMIIPQVAENLTRSGPVAIPGVCHVCGGETQIKQENDVRSLYCINKDCIAKQIKAFTQFVSRDGMNIEGLSEATIEKLISKGIIKEYGDIYKIDQYKEEIVGMEGLGEKSFKKLVASIDKSRKTNVTRLLYSLGIPNVGLSNAKLICKKFNQNWKEIESATYSQLIEVNGIGEVMADSYDQFFKVEKNKENLRDLLMEIEFEPIKTSATVLIFENIVFVITGTLEQYKSREALVAEIEEKGGKVTSSVTSKTNYLINNELLSNSSKNKKAKELGISIITENQLKDWLSLGIIPENNSN